MHVIFDIDGTLSDPEHRLHFVERPTGVKKDWDSFRVAADEDTVIQPVATVLRSLFKMGHDIILCTGRMETERALTEVWCLNHRIFYNALYMRAAGDFRDDSIVKGELLDRMRLEGYDPKMVFDDRARVVALWRSRGLICAQVAEGDF